MRSNELQVNGWAGYPNNIPDRTLNQAREDLHLGILKQDKYIWKKEQNVICVVLFKSFSICSTSNHTKKTEKCGEVAWTFVYLPHKNSVQTGDI